MKQNLHVINFSTYTSPEIVEKKNKDWVEYGNDNNYYQYLIDLYHGSPTNNRCVKGIADLIYGGGLDAKRSSKNLKAYIELKKLFSEKCLRNVAMDLKLLGSGVFQIVKAKNKQSIAKVYHFPRQTIRPEKCNDKGEVDAYYYFHDWSKLKRGEMPKRIPNFEYYPEAQESLLVIQPYSTGSFYFSPVDYQGGLQYAELETEISNFHINNIKNGMSPSMLINFNNGEPSEEAKTQIESAILSKFSGSSSTGRAIISWNDSSDQKADITPVQLSDAHNQYQFLSSESQDKILVAHGITSPLIFGIKNASSGFSSNADELKTSIVLFDNMVIRPFQQMITESVDKILEYHGVSLDLYFKQLNPLQDDTLQSTNVSQSYDMKYKFTEDNNLEEKSIKLKEPCWDGYEMIGFKTLDGQKVPNCVPIENTKINRKSVEMSENDEANWLTHLNDVGEVINNEEWELVDVQDVNDYDEDDRIYSQFTFMADYSEPDEKSKDDKGIYKIRYRYGPDRLGSNSRNFCQEMVSLNKQGVVYRREDIQNMSDAGVNGQFSPKGESTYSIWNFKGGVACHHKWERLTFRRKYQEGRGNAPIPITPSEKSSDTRDMEYYKPVSNIEADSKGVPFDPPNWTKAQTRPIDMPNKGGLKK